MNMRSIILVIAAILLLVGVSSTSSCKHGKCNDGGNSSLARDSHNAGKDCMQCHMPDGEGEVCWTIGGTVYSADGGHPVSGQEVRLFTKPLGKGELRQSLVTDLSGNAYTSANILFDHGLFPAVINANGDTAFMNAGIHDGACNRCHGVTTDKVKIL